MDLVYFIRGKKVVVAVDQPLYPRHVDPALAVAVERLRAVHAGHREGVVVVELLLVVQCAAPADAAAELGHLFLVVVVVFVALQAVEVVGPSRFLPLTADLADLRVGRGVVERGPVVFVLVLGGIAASGAAIVVAGGIVVPVSFGAPSDARVVVVVVVVVAVVVPGASARHAGVRGHPNGSLPG